MPRSSGGRASFSHVFSVKTLLREKGLEGKPLKTCPSGPRESLSASTALDAVGKTPAFYAALACEASIATATMTVQRRPKTEVAKEAHAAVAASISALDALNPEAKQKGLVEIQMDLEKITAAALKKHWTDTTTVRSDFFGERWSEGTPPGWPDLIPYDPALLDTIQGLGNLDSRRSATGKLQRFERRVDEAQRSLWNEAEALFGEFEGKELGDLIVKQRIAALIQQIANRLTACFKCPYCEQPARLRCAKSGRSKEGRFEFDHFIAGKRTTCGGTVGIPPLKLTARPAHRRSTSVQ